MDGDHGIPLVLGHVYEHPVAEDSRVVDEDVEPPELVDRLLHEPLRAREVGDVLAVRRRLAAGGADLLDDLLGRAGVGSLAGERRAPRSLTTTFAPALREGERVRAADPAPRAGDDRDLAAQIWHGGSLVTRSGRGSADESIRSRSATSAFTRASVPAGTSPARIRAASSRCSASSAGGSFVELAPHDAERVQRDEHPEARAGGR